MHLSPYWQLGKNLQSSFGWRYGQVSSVSRQLGQCLHLTFFLSSLGAYTNYYYFILILFLWVARSITLWSPDWSLISSKGALFFPYCYYLYCTFYSGYICTFFTLLNMSLPASCFSYLINVSKSTLLWLGLFYTLLTISLLYAPLLSVICDDLSIVIIFFYWGTESWTALFRRLLLLLFVGTAFLYYWGI